MADQLDQNSQLFLDSLISSLPTNITIAESIDIQTLQTTLEKNLRDSFEKLYQPIEKEIQGKVENVRKETEKKVGEMQKSQEAQQSELNMLLGQMKEKQEQQGQLVTEIETIVVAKTTEMANSHAQFRTEIDQMRGKVTELSQQTQELYAKIQAKQLKVEIQSNIVCTGERVKFSVFNTKLYCFEECVLRFQCDYGVFDSGVVDVMQGRRKSDVTALLPENLPGNTVFAVAIYDRDGKMISNVVEFQT